MSESLQTLRTLGEAAREIERLKAELTFAKKQIANLEDALRSIRLSKQDTP